MKTTQVSFNNSTEYFNLKNGSRSKDIKRTSVYKYNESINAAYFQASKNISGIIIKAGARLENTNMEGNQSIPYDTSFAIHRTDLFPYVY